jgi:hypothetical protein
VKACCPLIPIAIKATARAKNAMEEFGMGLALLVLGFGGNVVTH